MTDEQNSESLLAALKAERASGKATREQLETVNRQIAERSNQFARSREIDPAKYQELLAMEQRIADEELKQNQDWDVLKSNFEKQAGELNTQIQTYQKKYKGLIAQQAIKDAFLATGGIVKVDDGDVSALDLVAQYFTNRVQVIDDRITLLDRSGNRESMSLVDKMLELKRGSMKSLFASPQPSSRPAPSSIGVNSQQLIVYTQEQARSGKADMKKVATGLAVIRG
jgi:hypothetical protein